jgi:UV DNA damage endonuclease
MIRFGLCCLFKKEPIKFRRTTAKFLAKYTRAKQLDYLSKLCFQNANSLSDALRYCQDNDIKDFRISSQILPLKTHPEVGYQVEELPRSDRIIETFSACGTYSRKNNLRTTFHPDQFILLSSPRQDVIERSLADLVYQAEVAEWVNVDVINIHAGGTYGNKRATLERLHKQIDKLPETIRSRLTLENDDKMYSPEDLLPLCKAAGIPLVYDVHHHRCFPDGKSIEETTGLAFETWDREPLVHISSPLNGWEMGDCRNHHDYINPLDFPEYWLNLDLTVEVEAKAKELAVLKLKHEIEKRQYRSKSRDHGPGLN